MTVKMHLKSIIIYTCIYLIIGCGKKEEYKTGELTPKESTSDTTEIQTIKPQSINYDSMLVVVSELVETIKENPTDMDYRRELVAVSYDTTWGTILSAGHGKPSPNAESESLAINFAERAATVDALRWAAYIKRWSIDPNAPDLVTINAEIQGYRVVAKKVHPDKAVTILVEIHSSKIL